MYHLLIEGAILWFQSDVRLFSEVLQLPISRHLLIFVHCLRWRRPLASALWKDDEPQGLNAAESGNQVRDSSALTAWRSWGETVSRS